MLPLNKRSIKLKSLFMQKAILVVLLVIGGAVTVNAQSLKEALYGGKLKMDSNSVLRKTDDIKAKIDTAQRKPAETVKPVPANTGIAAATVDSSKPQLAAGETAAVVNNTIANADETDAVADAPVKAATTPTKTNTKIIKEHSDALIKTLQEEVLSNKKIKKESYYVLVAYEMDTTSQVNITSVTTTPANALLQSAILQHLQNTPPQLNPTLDSAGKPRKIKRTYSFTVMKD
jgi:membrane-bound lytic murein transglycosylase